MTRQTNGTALRVVMSPPRGNVYEPPAAACSHSAMCGETFRSARQGIGPFTRVQPVVHPLGCVTDLANVARGPQRHAAEVVTPPTQGQVRVWIKRRLRGSRLPLAQDLRAAGEQAQRITRPLHQRLK